MARYLNPKSDLVFKKIFGEHPDLLISFLNAFLPLAPNRLITEITYLPPEHIPEIPGFKYTVVDVRCKDTEGRYFIVEMQLNWSEHFIQRMVFNTAATYIKQLPKGIKYETLCPVYGVAIVDGNLNRGPDWFHHYQLINPKKTDQTLEDLQLIFLELPKFKPTTLTEKKLSVLWMRYMTEINEKTEHVDSLLLDEPTIHKALNLTEVAAYTPEELRSYDANWDAISTANTLFSDKYNQGREEGIEIGVEKGRQEEREKAEQEKIQIIKKAEQEKHEEKRQMAKTSLSEGIDVSIISKITGFSIEKVERIKAEIIQVK